MALTRMVMYWLGTDGVLHSYLGDVITPPPPPPVGTPSARITVTSQVNLRVVLSASQSTEGTPGVSLTGYTWDMGDGTTLTGLTADHTYAKGGTYRVTLTVTDSLKTSSTQAQVVAVTPANVAPTASFTATPSGLAVSVDGTASTDSDGSIAKLAWTFGDGGAATGVTASHTYAAAGTYTITLTVTDDKGATASTTRSVTVAIANRPPVAKIVVTTSGMTSTYDASGSTDPDGNALTYDVDWGDGTAHSTSKTNSHVYTANGPWTVTLVVTDSKGLTDTTTGTATPTQSGGGSASWADGNEPWRIGGLTDDWPQAALDKVVQYNDSRWFSASKTFTKICQDAAAIVPGAIIKLPAGTYHLTKFDQAVSGTQGYVFFGKSIGGLLGAGPESTFIVLDSNALVDPLLTSIKNATNAISVYTMRFDNAPYISGITFDAHEQPLIDGTAVAKPNGYPSSYSAPYAGLQYYNTTGGITQNVRFRGFGKCWNNVYPYELGAVNTSGASHTMRRYEIDGRTAASINSTRPRVSGGFMYNNGGNFTLTDGWEHHSKRSGHTIFGKTGSATLASGTFNTTRVRINDNANINDGDGGTYTFSAFNHEQAVGAITYTNCQMQRSNIASTGRATYITVGANNNLGNPKNIVFNFDDKSYWENPPATDNGMFSVFNPPTYGSTSNIYHDQFKAGAEPIQVFVGGKKLKPVFVSSTAVGSWPTVPSSHTASQLAAAGYTPTTAFLIRTA